MPDIDSKQSLLQTSGRKDKVADDQRRQHDSNCAYGIVGRNQRLEGVTVESQHSRGLRGYVGGNGDWAQLQPSLRRMNTRGTLQVHRELLVFVEAL